jgi:hypothetical protein
MTASWQRSLHVCATLLVSVLLLAACGGEDVVTTETGGSVPELPDTADVEDTTRSAPDVGFLGDECTEALAAFSSVQVATSESTAAAVSGSADFAQIEDDLEELAAAAPAEIRSAFETYAEVLSEYLRELAAVGLEPGSVPTQEQLERLQTLSGNLDTDDLQDAAQEIEAYFSERCGG